MNSQDKPNGYEIAFISGLFVISGATFIYFVGICSLEEGYSLWGDGIYINFIIGLGVLVFGLLVPLSYFTDLDKESPTLPTKSMNEIDFMDGYKFEKYVGNLYRNMGYEVQYTPLSGDQGADLIISKNNDKTAVQTKCYRGKVSNKAIQEVVSSKVLYDCNKCAVVTNSYFTDSAIQLGTANNVELIDRDNIIKIINEVHNLSNCSSDYQTKSDLKSTNKITSKRKKSTEQKSSLPSEHFGLQK
jgi:HJR/Mrr/RecB family endonuclease